jgi:hypothetical protein
MCSSFRNTTTILVLALVTLAALGGCRTGVGGEAVLPGSGVSGGSAAPSQSAGAPPQDVGVILPETPTAFAGDTAQLAAELLGVEADQLQLAERLDYGYAVADVYRSTQSRTATCGVDSRTGEVRLLSLGAAPVVEPKRAVIDRQQALDSALKFLKEHGWALAPDAQLEVTREGGPSSSVYVFQWTRRLREVLLLNRATVEVNAYTGEVLFYAASNPPLQVALEPKYDRSAATESARKFAEGRKAVLDAALPPVATLMVRFVPFEMAPPPEETWQPGDPPLKTTVAVKHQALVWHVSFTLSSADMPLPYRVPGKLEVYVDAHSGEVVGSEEQSGEW